MTGAAELSFRRRRIYNGFVNIVAYGQFRSVVPDLGPKMDRGVPIIERVAAAAHYVVWRAEPGQLGHAKLNTILWYADLDHYRRAGASMTGLTQYARDPLGMFAAEISRAVGLLVRLGKVHERTVEVADYARREMISLQAPDPAALTEVQMGILNRMIDAIAPLTARQLIEMTQNDPLWLETKPWGAMVIATGSIITRVPGDQQSEIRNQERAVKRVSTHSSDS
jgi:hypothetical protein